jgi:hypothetical protein
MNYITFPPNKTIKELGIDTTREFIVCDTREYCNSAGGDIFILEKDDESSFPFFKRKSDGLRFVFNLYQLAYADSPQYGEEEKEEKKGEHFECPDECQVCCCGVLGNMAPCSHCTEHFRTEKENIVEAENQKVEETKTIENNISNCTFIGIQFDELSIDTLNTCAKALLNITELFRAQNVHIDNLLRIEEKEK